MKRFAAILLIFALLLSGCSVFGSRIKEPVTFYYVQSSYQYGSDSPVIVTETREASGRMHDLPYLIRLYLTGPLEDDRESPFPRSVTLVSVGRTEDTVEITLSDSAGSLSDAQYSLACACLSLTCINITGAENVRISSADRSITLSASDLMLTDQIAEIQSVEETQ